MHLLRFDPALKREGIFSRLPEMYELEMLLEKAAKLGRVEKLTTVTIGNLNFPLYCISFGVIDDTAPIVALFGGVHGLERIGTHVLLSYLKTTIELLEWDVTFQKSLENCRLVFVPLVNPAGMFLQRRSNANGVDLMRNSPTHAEKLSKLFIAGGHRISPMLPWFQGKEGAPMEPEAQAVCDFVRKHVYKAKTAVTLDVHSGFGAVDRLWFPYARTKRPFHSVAEVFGLKVLLDRTYPNHIYRIEPQSRQYRAHGDLWDFLYDEHRKIEKSEGAGNENLFLPLSLELGSWNWMKKNLRQVFSLMGAFNPLAPHRLSRTLRRHILFFEFLQRAIVAPDQWAVISKEDRDRYRRRALELWYG